MKCSEEPTEKYFISKDTSTLDHQNCCVGNIVGCLDSTEQKDDTTDESQADESQERCGSKKSEESEERQTLKMAMLEHLSTSDRVFFRNTKENEGEIEKEKKIFIANELLNSSYSIFLAKFGNYLFKEHLKYFENRSEEESIIVDIHLKQLHKALEQNIKNKKTKNDPVDGRMEMVIELSLDEQSRLSLRNNLLQYLSQSKEAHFRSQQIGEPDLDQQEKREIAEALLDRSASLFLARFGTYLLEEHLVYFDQTSHEASYDIAYHLKELRKTHCKVVSEVGIKNRRFEALKKMVVEGSYFCETEMRNRNPLLYEQLVGRFLTADERNERLNNIDTTNITFVNLLLEQMDREAVKKLKKTQEEAEDDAMEEEENSSDEEMEEENESEEDNDLDKSLWGEGYSDDAVSVSNKKPTRNKKVSKKEEENAEEEGNDDVVAELSDSEKQLLMQEFRSNMYSSFLQGKDTDFDYSKVDYNSDYDNLEMQGQDAEEKYFDEESPQDESNHKMSDEEDLLDQYMKGLKPEPTPQQLAEKIECLSHKDM